jgi:2-aminoadipate transaminase
MSFPPSGPEAPVAARLRGVASSPVREILALTEKPGVLSFAGGLPAPELFDHAGLAAALPFSSAVANAAASPTGSACAACRPARTTC